MAVTITYTISESACDGGAHFDVTVTSPLGSTTYHASLSELKEAPEKHELITFAKILLRGVVAQVPNLTHAKARDRLHNLSIDISPNPAS
jgi:hypothetical protein